MKKGSSKSDGPMKPKCVVPQCGEPSVSRGLCGGHYSGAAKAVQLKVTSWKKLEAQGKALPSTRRSGVQKYFSE